ncbi:hypothetical protein PIB30_055148 [Stylosanthes scabra]|uniref:Secreted protein n=1 Tax=Stylosanthes scabra TaxID=79078 RepID=A0ABU6RJX1_9FABA|nr:hypothetical protein [Stylosanthes scabra]
MSYRWQGRWICCRTGFSGGFPSFALTLSTTLSVHWSPVRMSPVSDVGGRGGARSRHSAGGTHSPLVLDRPTYILWDHRVAPG